MILTELSGLAPAERAKRYRELAGDARREAASAPPATWSVYTTIAVNWELLAADIESELKRQS